MTSDELNAIKARNAARTPGQWTWEPDPVTLYAGRTDEFHGLNLLGRLGPDRNGEANMDFIAACSEDVPALIAEVERLKSLLKLAYHAIYVSSSGLSRANLKNDIEAVLEE